MAEVRSRQDTRQAQLKCAIYTRKSSEEGLDQDFNSLDAQREACEAYIKSQRHEGWQALDAYYDDGGISGGTMERPALKRMLEDIKTGKVNIVVVYKVDRLTRSLADFAKIVEIFDKAGASFVSVTQQFNTTSSMGRLTLNVLLSFAQFEREVTGERIRDKIAASKKKGMWMGGNLPLGYDTHDRKLVINDEEAKLVRHIYERYIELGSVDDLRAELQHKGIVSKVRVGRQGRSHGGIPFGRGALYHLLQNRLYLGEIVHKDQHYPGNHEAIVPKDLWEQAQKITQENRIASTTQTRAQAPSVLAGLLFDEHGERLIPSHANKGGIRYRYYVTKRPKEEGQKYARNLRIPAGEIEGLIVKRLKDFLSSRDEITQAIENEIDDVFMQEALVCQAANLSSQLIGMNKSEICSTLRLLINHIQISTTKLDVHLNQNTMVRTLGALTASLNELPKTAYDRSITLSISVELKRVSNGIKIITKGLSMDYDEQPDKHIVKLIVRAFHYKTLLINGNGESLSSIANSAGVSASYFTRILRLALLPKEQITTLMAGRWPQEKSKVDFLASLRYNS